MMSPRFGGDLVVVAPVIPATLTAPGGRVRISATLMGAGGWIDLLDGSVPVAMGAGLGVAVGFLTYDAESTSRGVRGQDGTVPFALPYVRWALEWPALPPLGLRADVLAGVAAPRPVIQTEGRDSYAVFGRPLLAAGLGLSLSLP